MNRHLLLLSALSAVILVPIASHALPLIAAHHSGEAGITLIDDDSDDDGAWGEEGHGHGHHRHGGQGAGDCAGDDDDDGACGSGQAMAPQNSAPPSNGLFMPGAKPKAQIN